MVRLAGGRMVSLVVRLGLARRRPLTPFSDCFRGCRTPGLAANQKDSREPVAKVKEAVAVPVAPATVVLMQWSGGMGLSRMDLIRDIEPTARDGRLCLK